MLPPSRRLALMSPSLRSAALHLNTSPQIDVSLLRQTWIPTPLEEAPERGFLGRSNVLHIVQAARFSFHLQMCLSLTCRGAVWLHSNDILVALMRPLYNCTKRRKKSAVSLPFYTGETHNARPSLVRFHYAYGKWSPLTFWVEARSK